jgi:hypothetical protein
MLAKLPKEVWRKHRTFLDPSCGNGQFLVHVLFRKIQRGHKPLDALKCIFGVDIMSDNIKECRMRLLKITSAWETITEEHIKAVLQNIIWINQKNHPGGSLDYDFAFDKKPRQKEVDKWMDYIHKQHLLDEVELPVEEAEFLKSGQFDLFDETGDDLA